MAVERLTDYTRRIWTALDADAPEDHDIQVNDVIYYMDSSECCVVTHVYPDGSIDCETLPDVGGGGGSAGINLRLLASGTHTLLANQQRAASVPVELPDDVTFVLIKVTSVDQSVMSNHRMAAWWRAYNVESYLPSADFPAPQEAKVITTGGVSQWVARANGNVSSIIWLTDAIGFTVVSNSYMIYAGDYNWEIWGY